MLRKGSDSFSSSVNGSVFTDVASFKVMENVDRVVMAVYNTDKSASLEKITFRVLVQFIKNGGFVEFGAWDQAPLGRALPSPLGKDETFWGCINDFGIETVKVQALRSGSVAIPITVEYKCLAEGLD